MATEATAQAQGIDVSRYQRDVDWPVVKEAGISFAIAKASESTFMDPKFTRNWPGMKQAGILRGAYHFFRPSQDPLKQADFFAKTLEADPGEIPPVLDVEGDDGLTNVSLIRSVEACLTRIEQRLNRRPMIYTRAGFWNQKLWDRPGHYPDWAPGYKLWVAHYTTAPKPLLPKSWTNWDIWQYTETGTVNGVTSGKVDRNRFNGTEADLLVWAGLTPPVVEVDILAIYFQALNGGDFDALLGLYQPAAAYVTAQQTISGADALRLWYQDLLQKLPGATFMVVESNRQENTLTFTWTCMSTAGNILDGQDTLNILDGKINYHNTLFTITPSST